MLTLSEINEKLVDNFDPDDIIILLGITTEELLEKFDYRVEAMYDELNEELSDEPD
jgi:hypothetical protein